MVVNGKQAIRTPKTGENIVQFKNQQRPLPAPFVICDYRKDTRM